MLFWLMLSAGYYDKILKVLSANPNVKSSRCLLSLSLCHGKYVAPDDHILLVPHTSDQITVELA
jgi:hypothetical protein